MTVSIALISMYFPDVSERVKGGEQKRRDWVDDACLELDHLSLPLLVASQLEVLRSLQRHLDAPLALRALHTQHVLRRLGLFPQDGFGLSAESLLLPVITPSPLSKFGLLGFLVLRHAELLVRVALWVRTEGPPGLRNVHHFGLLSVWR